LTLFLSGALPVRAESIGETVGNDLASPVTTKALTPLLIGTGLTIGLFALKSKISHPFQETISNNRPLDRWASLGDWGGRMYPNYIYIGYSLISASFGNPRGLLRAEEMALATVYSGVATSVLKVVFREGRPNNPTDKKSMPSGHATTAFAFAGLVGAEHEWYWAVPAYSLALITAYSRINDNKHYLHDVMAGATIGVSYALGVYYRRRDRDSSTGAKVSAWPTFTLLPADGLNGAILGAAKLF